MAWYLEYLFQSVGHAHVYGVRERNLGIIARAGNFDFSSLFWRRQNLVRFKVTLTSQSDGHHPVSFGIPSCRAMGDCEGGKEWIWCMKKLECNAVIS